MWDLSSPTRDPTRAPCSGALITGLPGNCLNVIFLYVYYVYNILRYSLFYFRNTHTYMRGMHIIFFLFKKFRAQGSRHWKTVKEFCAGEFRLDLMRISVRRIDEGT